LLNRLVPMPFKSIFRMGVISTDCPLPFNWNESQSISSARRSFWLQHRLRPGLPDFSWCDIPKPEICTKWTKKLPNIYQTNSYQTTIRYTKWS
jgi:hypothetical protein